MTNCGLRPERYMNAFGPMSSPCHLCWNNRSRLVGWSYEMRAGIKQQIGQAHLNKKWGSQTNGFAAWDASGSTLLRSQNSKKQWHSFLSQMNSFGQNINIYWCDIYILQVYGSCSLIKHYSCPLIGQYIHHYHFLYFYIQAFQKLCIKASVELCLEQQYAFYSAVIVFILLYISFLLSRFKRLYKVLNFDSMYKKPKCWTKWKCD